MLSSLKRSAAQVLRAAAAAAAAAHVLTACKDHGIGRVQEHLRQSTRVYITETCIMHALVGCPSPHTPRGRAR